VAISPQQLAVYKAEYEAGGVFETGLRPAGPKCFPFSWWPGCVAWARISSGFGSRYNRVGNERDGWLWHLGTDWHEPVGTPIVAIADGNVTAAIPETDPASGARGNTVIQTVEHGYALPDSTEPIFASFTHLQSLNVVTGQRIRRGDVIGTLGASGPNVGSPHLHLNVYSGSRPSATVSNPGAPNTSFRYRYDFLQLMSGDMTPITPADPPVPRPVLISFMDQVGKIYPSKATVIWPFICEATYFWRIWM